MSAAAWVVIGGWVILLVGGILWVSGVFEGTGRCNLPLPDEPPPNDLPLKVEKVETK